MLSAGAADVDSEDVGCVDVGGCADDDDDEGGGWDDVDEGCAAAGTAGANASEVAASTDMTRAVRETAMDILSSRAGCSRAAVRRRGS
jgi:hypothetical protein